MKTTVKTEIDAVSEVYRGHGVPTTTLSRWLCDVDAYIAREILHIDDWKAEYSYDEAPDVELLVSEAPYRRLYFLYLSAMIDFVCKQYNTYANELGEYNRALDDYRHYIVCRYNPASKSTAQREGYYISPYNLAVKYGYGGTEEEWLRAILPKGEAKVVALSIPHEYTADEKGYGTCIVMHDSRTCLVFDLGNDGGDTLRNYLFENNISTIDAIFISHFHSDHYQSSALQTLIDNYKVKSIVLPHTHNSLGSGNDAYKQCYTEAENTAKSANIICHKPTEEGKGFSFGDFTVTCHNVSEEYATEYTAWKYSELLYTAADSPTNYNNYSMVNVVTYAGHKIVVTGDIMAPAIEKTIEVLSTADLIFVPHHGLDIRIPPSAFNRLTAKHAVINWAYDADANLTRISRAFAGELLKKGCRVTTTYDGDTVEYSVGETITPIREGVLAGNEILPCSLLPYEDLNTIPDGEYITTREAIAKTLINAPTFVTTGKNFRLKVESVYYSENIRTQTAYNVYTSHNPEIAHRSYDGSAWGAWGVFFPYDKFNTKVVAGSDDELDTALISQIEDMGDATHRRIYMKLTAVLSNGMGGHYDVDIFKQSENYAIITAKSPIGYGTTLQRAWFDGVLYDWEWVNPRMIVGVEYRTIERYKDRAIYKKIDADGNIMCRLDGDTEWKSFASLLGAGGGAVDTDTVVNAVLKALPTWNGGSY